VRKIAVTLVSIMVFASFVAVGHSGASERPLFHGFSGDGNLIISTNTEILWLQPDTEAPISSLPCTKSYLLPESNSLLALIDNTIVSVDFDFTTIDMFNFAFVGEPSIQAKGDVIVASDSNGSHLFHHTKHITSSDALMTLGQKRGELQIVSFEGEDGILLFNESTGNAAKSDIGSEFSFWGNNLVAISADKKFAYLLDVKTLDTIHSFPVSDCYFLNGSLLLFKQSDKTFIINPEDISTRFELPSYDKCQLFQEIFIGFDNQLGFISLSVPELDILYTDDSVHLGEWAWFKAYKDYIVVNSDAGSNYLIEKATGRISQIDCKPISNYGNLFLCQDGDTISFYDVTTNSSGSEISINAMKPNLLSFGKGMANILYENSDGESLISTIEVSTGSVVNSLYLNPNVRILVGAPVEYSQTQQGSILFDADSIKSIRDSGFSHATPLFFDKNDSHKMLVTSPSCVEITKYFLND